MNFTLLLKGLCLKQLCTESFSQAVILSVLFIVLSTISNEVCTQNYTIENYYVFQIKSFICLSSVTKSQLGSVIVILFGDIRINYAA